MIPPSEGVRRTVGKRRLTNAVFLGCAGRTAPPAPTTSPRVFIPPLGPEECKIQHRSEVVKSAARSSNTPSRRSATKRS